MMTERVEARDTYRPAFEAIEKGLAALGPPWLHRARVEALDRFEQLGFPTADHEEWRFTNVAPIARIPFALPGADGGLRIVDFSGKSWAMEGAHRLVLVNGHYAPQLSDTRTLPRGVTVASLAEILTGNPEQVEPHLTRHASYQDHPFTALNTAFFRDGAFVSIARGQVVEKPIHLVLLTGHRSEPAMAHPRTLIVAGENSQASVIETYLSLGGLAFSNAVTEVVLGEGAVLDHHKLQRESTEAFHVATMHVLQQRSSRCSLLSVALGSALARNEVNVVLDAEGCECSPQGLSLAAGRQLIDHHTRIDHVRSHCQSRQLYKAILDGQSRGVFNGKIYVHPDAQKTDAKQTNQTLLLSEEAVINTKPQLEIFADDVKCTHGATVGQLDPEALFYLRTRGIDRQAARRLLTYAFANEVVSRIKVEPLRAEVEDFLSVTWQPPERGRG
jgi:Fe-S cluster assembly protein SufD